MSKTVKNMMSQDVASRLAGVEDALLVNVIGMNSSSTYNLRKHLRSKGIQIMVVKNSLAKRASEGTRLASAFDNAEGSLALVWGAEDIISLAKEITRIDRSGEYKGFAPKGGVMDGEALTAEKVAVISKWPNRTEQLSILMGQILSPGANLSSQLLGPGGLLASQLKEMGSGEGEASASEAASPAADASAVETPAAETPAAEAPAAEAPAAEAAGAEAPAAEAPAASEAAGEAPTSASA
jgi:large subunit ribosomal protein L10